MEINGPSRISGAESVRSLQSTQSIQPQPSTDGLQPMDQIDISPEAELVSRTRQFQLGVVQPAAPSKARLCACNPSHGYG